MKSAEAAVSVLMEQQAKVVFGIPGGQTLFFTDALRAADIRFVQTRHEGVAAGAADAYGRLTGKPGMCLATTGPGATNLLTSIGGALRDSSPLIAFVFQNTLAGAGRGDAQEADHELLFGSLVKKYIPVRHSDAVVWAMREAYRVAMTGRPGPVVVDFYRDVIEKGECDYTPQTVESYCAKMEFAAPESQIDALVTKLSSFEKIAIWSGNGVKMSHCGEKVLALAEKLNAPVVTTFNGIGSVSAEDSHVFGARTRHGTKLTKTILEEADCVLVLGSSMSSVSTNRWGLKLNNCIQVDFAPEQIGKQYPVAMSVLGELHLVLDALNEKLSARLAGKAWLADLQSQYAAWKKNVFSGPVNDETVSPVAPVALMRKLNECFYKDSIICVDAGNPGAWSHLFCLTDKNRYFKPVNYGNMGFSISAGIGCSIAEPERDIMCFIGDGSLGMTLGDLETVARFTKHVTIIVFNDHAYGNIKQEELFKFGEGHYFGVDLYQNADYVGVAKALGLGGEKVISADGIVDAVKRARSHDGSYLINVEFDGSYSIWPEAFLWHAETDREE
ncbi:MAG: thiamine pyrophosphate-binding protein [Clostridia bacterium]